MNKFFWRASIPFVFGIVGMTAYVGYFIVKDSGNNIAFDIRTLLPPLSFLSGIVAAILTRTHKETNHTLWWSGLVICLVGTVSYLLLILLLICTVLAVREL